MPQGTTETAKRLVEHLIGTLLHIWRLVARVAVIAGVSAVLLTEIVAAITTQQLPSGPTHLVAAALGIAAAYGAAATVLISEIFLGLLHTLHVLEGDVAAGATAAAALAAHEARAAHGELDQIFARRPARQAQPPARAPQPRAARSPVPERPLATPANPARARAAMPTPQTDPQRVEAFAAELPAQLPPLPVRADRLPRIEWANEEAPTIPPSRPADSADPASLAAPSADTAPPQEAESGPTLAELGLAGVTLAAGGMALRAHAHTDPATPSPESPAESAMPLPPLPSQGKGAGGLGESPAESATTPPPPMGEGVGGRGPAESAASGLLSPHGGEAGRGVPPVVVPTLTIPAPTPATASPTPALHDEPLHAEPGDLGEDMPLVPPPTMAASQPLPPISQPLAEPPTFRVLAAEEASPRPDAAPLTTPRPSGRVTRPLTRPLAPITGPLTPITDPLTSPSGSGNLWDRLSQALMGIPPVDPIGEPLAEDTAPDQS